MSSKGVINANPAVVGLGGFAPHHFLAANPQSWADRNRSGCLGLVSSMAALPR